MEKDSITFNESLDENFDEDLDESLGDSLEDDLYELMEEQRLLEKELQVLNKILKAENHFMTLAESFAVCTQKQSKMIRNLSETCKALAKADVKHSAALKEAAKQKEQDTYNHSKKVAELMNQIIELQGKYTRALIMQRLDIKCKAESEHDE